MVMYEQDSTFAQWGRHLFDCDTVPYSGYCLDDTQLGSDDYYIQYAIDDYDDYINVENDEIIAHTLQEELSQLAVTEAPQFSYEEEHAQVPVVHDWQTHSEDNYYSGHESDQNEVDAGSTCTSCSSSGEISYDDDNEYLYTLELTDEFELDGEVGKRLDQMIPVPHVPRINGEIPSIDEATSDHQRLLDRLEDRGLVEHKVKGDGNCQFRALSDQLYHIPEHHKYVRRQVVNQIKSHPELYEGYVPMEYSEYLKKISKSGEWGDHVTLQAAADLYCVRIVVITSFKDTVYIEILPRVQKPKKAIYLSFWSEVHYNSIYPQGESNSDTTSSEYNTKKRWWWFGN